MSPFFGESPPAWTDMSNFVVHFTRLFNGKKPYWNMLGILSQRRIRAMSAFGIGRKDAPNEKSQYATCFSEVPLHQLSRLADKRSKYGIVFRKDFVVHRHGNPILYAYKGGQLNQSIRSLMKASKKDPGSDIWKITPFIDAPGAYGKSTYFFEWEREWRKIGDFNFDTDDVECLIIPQDLHGAAKSFFIDVKQENLGPVYNCPFIDPYWSRVKIQKTLNAG